MEVEGNITEVKANLKKLNAVKSGDQLISSPKVLEEHAHTIASLMGNIFNPSFKSGMVP